MINKDFYFILETLFVFAYLNFSPDYFGHAEKWVDKKAKVNFKIWDDYVTDIARS